VSGTKDGCEKPLWHYW